MAMAGRIRSSLPLVGKALSSDSRSALYPALISNPKLSRNYASAPPAKEQKVKVPVTMYGVSGNYASALYISAVKFNVLEKVESELLGLIEASKTSPKFSQFMKDLTVKRETRVKAMTDISSQAKFGDITKNFLDDENDLGDEMQKKIWMNNDEIDA